MSDMSDMSTGSGTGSGMRLAIVVANLTRVAASMLLFLAVLNGSMLLVAIGLLGFGLDAWSQVKFKEDRELYDQWIAEQDARLEQARALLHPEQRKEYDRRLATLIAEFEREQQPVWHRWMHRWMHRGNRT